MSILCSKIIESDSAYTYLLGLKPDQKAIKELLKNWCREGNKKGANYLLIVRNTPNNENYPVFVYNPADLKKISQLFHTKHDSLVIEIYDLNDKKNIFESILKV